jgi:hypothetical protein
MRAEDDADFIAFMLHPPAPAVCSATPTSSLATLRTPRTCCRPRSSRSTGAGDRSSAGRCLRPTSERSSSIFGYRRRPAPTNQARG